VIFPRNPPGFANEVMLKKNPEPTGKQELLVRYGGRVWQNRRRLVAERLLKNFWNRLYPKQAYHEIHYRPHFSWNLLANNTLNRLNSTSSVSSPSTLALQPKSLNSGALVCLASVGTEPHLTTRRLRFWRG